MVGFDSDLGAGARVQGARPKPRRARSALSLGLTQQASSEGSLQSMEMLAHASSCYTLTGACSAGAASPAACPASCDLSASSLMSDGSACAGLAGGDAEEAPRSPGVAIPYTK